MKKMKKSEMEQLLKDIEKMLDSNASEYEEVLYPMIANYFYFRTGRLDDIYALPKDEHFWSSGLGRAFSVLGIDEDENRT